MDKLISVMCVISIVSLVFCSIQNQPVSAYEVTYIYDDAGRLTGAQYENGESIAYTYDLAGNLTSKTIGEICVHHGDVNFNGAVTAGDAQMAFQIVLGYFTPTTREACAADCNNDASVTAGDAQLIFNMVFGGPACADPLV